MPEPSPIWPTHSPAQYLITTTSLFDDLSAWNKWMPVASLQNITSSLTLMWVHLKNGFPTSKWLPSFTSNRWVRCCYSNIYTLIKWGVGLSEWGAGFQFLPILLIWGSWNRTGPHWLVQAHQNHFPLLGTAGWPDLRNLLYSSLDFTSRVLIKGMNYQLFTIRIMCLLPQYVRNITYSTLL